MLLLPILTFLTLAIAVDVTPIKALDTLTYIETPTLNKNSHKLLDNTNYAYLVKDTGTFLIHGSKLNTLVRTGGDHFKDTEGRDSWIQLQQGGGSLLKEQVTEPVFGPRHALTGCVNNRFGDGGGLSNEFDRAIGGTSQFDLGFGFSMMLSNTLGVSGSIGSTSSIGGAYGCKFKKGESMQVFIQPAYEVVVDPEFRELKLKKNYFRKAEVEFGKWEKEEKVIFPSHIRKPTIICESSPENMRCDEVVSYFLTSTF